MPSDTEPMRPVVTIAGVVSSDLFTDLNYPLNISQSGQKSSNHSFHLDINQYVAGETRLTSYICSFPPDNKRFQSLGIPKLGSTIVVTGFIVSEPVSDVGSIKRLPLEVKELAFLTSDLTPSPVKGSSSLSLSTIDSFAKSTKGKSSKWNWGNKSLSKSSTNDDSTSLLSKPLAEDRQILPSKHSREHTRSDTEDQPHPTKRAATKKTTRSSKGKQKTTVNTTPKENDGVEVKQEFIEGSSASPLSEVE
jgi:hypothetical protein